MTARTSSISSSNTNPPIPRSDRPPPERSNRISRENDDSLWRKPANDGFSHMSPRWVGHPNRNTRSRSPSPAT